MIKRENTKRIDYGSESDIEQIDEFGSTITTRVPIHKGKYMSSSYKRYEMKHPIRSSQDLMTALLKWSDKINEPNIVEPTIRTESTNLGFYLLVTAWTEKG